MGGNCEKLQSEISEQINGFTWFQFHFCWRHVVGQGGQGGIYLHNWFPKTKASGQSSNKTALSTLFMIHLRMDVQKSADMAHGGSLLSTLTHDCLWSTKVLTSVTYPWTKTPTDRLNTSIKLMKASSKGQLPRSAVGLQNKGELETEEKPSVSVPNSIKHNFPLEISSNSSRFANPTLSACFGIYLAPFSKAMTPSIDTGTQAHMNRAVKLHKLPNNKPKRNHSCPLLRFAYSFSVPALVFPGAMRVFLANVHVPITASISLTTPTIEYSI